MLCKIVGKPEYYGIGIRVSFYLLWAGLTLARWLCEPTLFIVLLVTHFIYACAVFLGLVITITTSTALSAAEVYLTMVLISGLACYVRIPYYIWRVATCFHKKMDSGFYYYHLGFKDADTETMSGPYVYGVMETCFMACVVGLQMWFWFSGVESSDLHHNGRDYGGVPCELQDQVGFVFRPAALSSPGFRAFNLVLIFAIRESVRGAEKRAEPEMAENEVGFSTPEFEFTTYEPATSKLAILAFKQLQTIFDLLVTPIVVSAVELTIEWNHIENVNSANAPGQLIPLLLGLLGLLMVVAEIILRLLASEGDSNSSEASEIWYYTCYPPLPPPAPEPVAIGPAYYSSVSESPPLSAAAPDTSPAPLNPPLSSAPTTKPPAPSSPPPSSPPSSLSSPTRESSKAASHITSLEGSQPGSPRRAHLRTPTVVSADEHLGH
ncbi:hypothetical protein OQA88_6474 [Cercophora sp. LCS_1]